MTKQEHRARKHPPFLASDGRQAMGVFSVVIVVALLRSLFIIVIPNKGARYANEPYLYSHSACFVFLFVDISAKCRNCR
jgi:hypothetical protein